MIVPFKPLHLRNAWLPIDCRDSGNDNTICSDVVSGVVAESDNDGIDEEVPIEFNC